jgi:hypothetical protein
MVHDAGAKARSNRAAVLVRLVSVGVVGRS